MPCSSWISAVYTAVLHFFECYRWREGWREWWRGRDIVFQWKGYCLIPNSKCELMHNKITFFICKQYIFFPLNASLHIFCQSCSAVSIARLYLHRYTRVSYFTALLSVIAAVFSFSAATSKVSNSIWYFMWLLVKQSESRGILFLELKHPFKAFCLLEIMAFFGLPATPSV